MTQAASKSGDQESTGPIMQRDTWHGARILVNQLRTAPAYAFANFQNKFQLTYPALYANFEGTSYRQGKRLELGQKLNCS